MLSQSEKGKAAIVVSKKEQQATIATYNQNKCVNDQIPMLTRNSENGWPLLQVTLMCTKENIKPGQETKYVPILNGGKCHFLVIAAYQFALLLRSLPGEVKTNLIDDFNLNDALKGYEFKNEKYKIEVNEKHGGFGSLLKVILPVEDKGSFAKKLEKAHEYALKEDCYISPIGGWEDNPENEYTENQLREMINSKVAVFLDGQIYIDFRALLNQIKSNNKEIVEFFETIFKVKEFLNLQNKDIFTVANLQKILKQFPGLVFNSNPQLKKAHENMITSSPRQEKK